MNMVKMVRNWAKKKPGSHKIFRLRHGILGLQTHNIFLHQLLETFARVDLADAGYENHGISWGYEMNKTPKKIEESFITLSLLY